MLSNMFHFSVHITDTQIQFVSSVRNLCNAVRLVTDVDKVDP